MTGDAPGSEEETRDEVHRLVRGLMRAALGVMRARRDGREADPDLPEAEALLQAAFVPIWARVQRIDLDVAPDSIGVAGAEVLCAADDDEGLIASLHGSGIRRLSVHPGGEIEEIKLVLAAAVAASRPGAEVSDLATALFRADLDHVRYEQVASVDAPEAALPRIEPSRVQPTGPPEALRAAVRQDASTTDSGVVRLETFDSTLYFLDDREIEYLKSAIDREYSQDLALNVLDLLLDILEARPEPSVRQEVIGILTDYLPALLEQGRFEAVAGLVAGIRDASRDATELAPEQKDALDRLRTSVSSEGALSQLFHALEARAVAPTARSMDILLRELRPAAIRQVLTWVDRLTDRHARAAVAQALDNFFTAWPHGLSRMLNAPEPDVVSAGLGLAERLKLDAFVDVVAEVAGHPSARIRRQVAETFAAIGTAAALRNLLGMVDDPAAEVRTVVYHTFKTRPSRGASGTLKRVLLKADLEALGQREKRTLFEAFGAVGGPEGVEVLAPLVRGRGPSGKRPSSHTRACAALGLGIIGTPGARAALEQCAKDRDPLVRSAAAAALRGER